MNKIKFFVDSGADISKELSSQYVSDILPDGISGLKMYMSAAGKDYLTDTFWSELPKELFFEELHLRHPIKPFQASFYEWLHLFEEAILEDFTVLYLSMSKEYSGGFKQGSIVEKLLHEKYPNARIFIVDSGIAGAAMKLIALKIAEDINSGIILDEEYISNLQQNFLSNVKLFALCNNSFYAYHGGRVLGFPKDNLDLNKSLLFSDGENNMKYVSQHNNIEECLEEVLSFLKKKSVKQLELSYTYDLPREVLENVLTKLKEATNKEIEHTITLSSPTSTSVMGPYSISLGVLY